MKKTKLLTILDGWGHSETLEHNAIKQANTPFFDSLLESRPHTLIGTSGADVGLLGDQMGNSEVGHLNLGAGRVVRQELSRIHNEIENGGFFHNPVLNNQFEYAVKNNKAVHIMGLLSDGGVHSHIDHIKAMLEMAVKQKCTQVYLHVWGDGRDCPPKSMQQYITQIEQKIQECGVGKIATIIGRYYAMDRDNHWERISQAFNLMIHSEAGFDYDTAQLAVDAAYERDETDEFINATTIDGGATIGKGDVVIFANYRADRARQITQSFIQVDFTEFSRGSFEDVQFACLTEYKKDFNLPVAYPAMKLNNVLGKYLSKIGKTQLRIAETEKYAHVTFFFNGGVEEPFVGEDRVLIPSPNVATYDLQPEMNAPELTDILTAKIESSEYDVIICNYANTDMVGHSGKLDAAILAVEAIDGCLRRVVESIQKIDGEMLITADHGNAEKMFDEQTGAAHTAHTSNLVPLVYISSSDLVFDGNHGTLADIAPTILKLMDVEQPTEMTGRSLLV